MNKVFDAVAAARPRPSYQDILEADGPPFAEVLRAAPEPLLPTADIPFSRYSSREFFDLEMQKVWRKVWQYACREEHIPNVGDYYVYDIGRYSLVVVRTEEGIKAYHNSCLHRGTKLKTSDTSGWSGSIQCPYHAWEWNLDGSIKNIPCKWDFQHVDTANFSLPEARVDTWNSLVFINFSHEGPDLQTYLEVLPEHFRNWDMTEWTISVHAQKELPCNWKAAQEAFIEAYHTSTVHPQCVGTSGDVNQQHDIFGDHVSRDLVPLGVASPSLSSPPSEQEILDQMLMGDRSIVGGRLLVTGNETARTVMARQMRETLSKQFGFELSGYSTAEILDSIKYTLFPNLFIFAGVSLKILYQYRPLGNDPDRCLFDIMFLRPVAKDEPSAGPAEVHRVGEHDSYCDVPGMDPGFGLLFDQDTAILRAQRDGMYASEKGTATYSNYLESRLRYIHQVIDKYINA